ncbi:hypothetical protein O6P43_031541 [Quillaja saponaria]|uniref:Uncharacterized protein n=1 Tax=Quillaja saponaria TaxID=32244 RepID=A0AAD7KVH5_QUISA|nr:hypothetical protein O6P43_031541 [Quillaja saponaria]
MEAVYSTFNLLKRKVMEATEWVSTGGSDQATESSSTGSSDQPPRKKMKKFCRKQIIQVQEPPAPTVLRRSHSI